MLIRLARTPWAPHVLALVIYTIAALAFFGWPLADLSHRCLCDNSPDPEAYMWQLAWWPHAIRSGINPIVTHAIFAPHAVNLAPVASIPGASVIAWPLTTTAGPLPAYNLLALASPILTGWAGFALCRYVSRSTPAALVGGGMFGFSSYEIGQLIGHLNLTLVFLVPLVPLLMLRLIDDAITPRRFLVLMTPLMMLQILLATEITATMAFVGVVALLVAYAAGDGALRARLRLLARQLMIAGAVTVVVLSPFLYYALLHDVPNLNRGLGRVVAADALSWFIPTDIIRFGSGVFSSAAHRFTADVSENGSYIPLPLLGLALAGLLTVRRPARRMLIITGIVVVVLALGSDMQILGHRTLPMPWSLVDTTPFFSQIAPARLAIYVWLGAAVLVSLALAHLGPRHRWLWAVAGVGFVLLIPNGPTNLWRAHVSLPRFFTAGAYKRLLTPGEVVLTLPAPQVVSSGANLWQAQARMYFRVAGGYIGATLPHEYAVDPAFGAIAGNAANPHTAADLRSFLARHNVRAVLIDASQPGPWPAMMASIGLRGEAVDGVLLYRIGQPARRVGAARSGISALGWPSQIKSGASASDTPANYSFFWGGRGAQAPDSSGAWVG